MPGRRIVLELVRAHAGEHGRGHAQAVEERRADDDLAVLQRLDDEREHGAEEDDEGEHGEEHVVRQEGALARDRGVDRSGGPQAVATRAPPARRMQPKPLRMRTQLFSSD